MTSFSKHKVFIGALAGLVLFLGGFVYVQERIVQLGDEVILATRPIDPRDLFRGEYVILRYAIENHELVKAGLSDAEGADTGYVRLETDENGVADVVEFSRRLPPDAAGIWLRGEIDRQRIRFPNLEQYFVPEGAGRPIERIRSGLHVRVRVHDGEGRAIGLLDENLADIDAYEYRE